MPNRIWGPYKGRIVRVHDGDTVMVDLDLGFDLIVISVGWDGSSRLACRIYGINAPELSTTEGKLARDFAQTLLHPGDIVSVLSYGWDKYGGRFDGSIRLADGRDFAQTMMNTGHAVSYLTTSAENKD